LCLRIGVSCRVTALPEIGIRLRDRNSLVRDADIPSKWRPIRKRAALHVTYRGLAADGFLQLAHHRGSAVVAPHLSPPPTTRSVLIGRSDCDSTSAAMFLAVAPRAIRETEKIPACELTIAKGGLKTKLREIWPKIIRQLGLKLEPGRGPVEVLVVDRLEKPTEN
jgi:Protein of unknown function (DUF3738)